MITGDLWNIDLWFFDKEAIVNAEKYKSLDVYKAVLENDVADVEDFLKLYS